MSRQLFGTGCIVLLVALAGCLGGFGGPTPGSGSSSSGDGGGTASGWCPEGSTRGFANPETGDRATLEIEGIVEHEGKEVCKAVWEGNSGEVRKMEMYYTEDDSYQHVVMYDGSGTVVNEFRAGEGAGEAGSGDGTGGDGDSTPMGDVTAVDWCNEGDSYAFANPETGERTSLEVQGLVEHRGRTVCKAVWESDSGDIQRIEMYYTDDDSYRHVIRYDGSGDVVDETEFGTGTTPSS